MNRDRQKNFLTFISTFVFVGFLSSISSISYGEKLYVEEVDEGAFEDGSHGAQAFIEDDLIDDVEPLRATNPVGVFKERIDQLGTGVKSSFGSSLREITASASNVEYNLSAILAGVLFLMLMLRFRRRSRKNRFS